MTDLWQPFIERDVIIQCFLDRQINMDKNTQAVHILLQLNNDITGF